MRFFIAGAAIPKSHLYSRWSRARSPDNWASISGASNASRMAESAWTRTFSKTAVGAISGTVSESVPATASATASTTAHVGTPRVSALVSEGGAMDVRGSWGAESGSFFRGTLKSNSDCPPKCRAEVFLPMGTRLESASYSSFFNEKSPSVKNFGSEKRP